ncbi:MAG: histidine phosphatase family protein [Candidatus Binatia bacterium]
MIYLVRHGETTWNRVGRHQGRDDSPLTENGIDQARAAGKTLRRMLPDIGSVCLETSPLGRARHTALIIAGELGFVSKNILVTPLLIEHHLGHWQGLTQAEIDARYPGAWQAREEHKWDFLVPGGESYAMVAERARQWLASERHAPLTIAITHAIMSRTLQGVYGGFTPAETVLRSHRQDRIYCLAAGRVEEISCET